MSTLKLSNSGWTYLLSTIVGIAVTYGASIETDPIEAMLQGTIWGLFVGSSLTAVIDALCNFKEYKWNAIGWIVVACGYGYWLSFHYEGMLEMSTSEAIYWLVFADALAALLIGWLFIGAFLTVKLKYRE